VKFLNKLITITITLITMIIFILYGKLFFNVGFPSLWKTVAFIAVAALILAMLYTGCKRINEIEKEDKDDFSKY